MPVKVPARLLLFFPAALFVFFASYFLQAAEPEELMAKARAAMQQNKKEEALRLASEAIQASPQDPKAYFLRGQIHEGAWDHEKAILDYTKVLQLDRIAFQVYNRRGSEFFKSGKIRESIQDFSKFIEHYPAQEPYHWQRGISYYYAREFEKGRKQFEIHQDVNSQDVENAVWHFLCVAREWKTRNVGD